MSGVSRTYYPVAPLPDTNARQAAITQRPASTALLTIDSEDRYKDYDEAQANPTSPYDFSIHKPESLMPGFMTRIGISEVVFPWTIPNINDKTDAIRVFYTGGDPAGDVIQLPVGFYTPAEIATALQTDIATLIPGFTMTYGTFAQVLGGGPVTSHQPLFQYNTNNGAVQVSFEALPYNSDEYPYSNNSKQLFDLLGFQDINSIPATEGNGAFTFCQSVRYIDIVCNQLTNSQAQKDQTSQSVSRDMLARIYVGSASGVLSTVKCSDPTFCPPGCAPTVIYKDYSTPKQIQWIPNQNIPGYLRFQVYDDTGDLLDTYFLASGEAAAAEMTDWSMTMLVTEN